MSDRFIGQIILFAGGFAPPGWAICDGRLLPIREYQALFTIIQTFYGGDGMTNFALPDLRGRVPVGAGQGKDLENYELGKMFGAEHVLLTPTQIPAHTHGIVATASPGNVASPDGAYLAETAERFGKTPVGTSHTYSSDKTAPVALNAGSVTPVGESQPHYNIQPSLVMNYLIALEGMYPSRP